MNLIHLSMNCLLYAMYIVYKSLYWTRAAEEAIFRFEFIAIEKHFVYIECLFLHRKIKLKLRKKGKE